MKRSLLIWLGIAAALLVHAALPTVPTVGNARIVVLANNLENYYYNYDESERPSYHDEAGLELKTQRIADMMIASGADIFAFCELEAKPIILEYLVAALNQKVGGDDYAFVEDGIYVTTDTYDNAIKAGYVYRKATVEPYGNNYAATNVAYYRNVMRIQAWTEKATGERFTLSMNHFKAKSDAASQAKRVDNATWLVNGLNSSKVKDPDILIMGDLNAEMDEDCIAVIEDGGYEEQLLRYDAYSYSYIYQGSRELIDHAFANSTMASQITGAAVWHTNTSVSYNTRYSDHDAVVVGLRLGEDQGEGFDQTPFPSGDGRGEAYKKIRHGQIIIIRGGVEYTITGQRID